MLLGRLLSEAHYLVERAPTVQIQTSNERAYRGRREGGRVKISKQDTRAIGEQIVLHHLKTHGHLDAHPLNSKKNNYPVDLATRHHLIEVKTGLVSNNEKSHHWRATIGQPGKEETEWLKHAGPEEKAKWNQRKAQAIMDRKNQALQEHSKQHHVQMSGKTYGVILHHDKKIADVHEFNGFHHRLGWKEHATDETHVGSYSYA